MSAEETKEEVGAPRMQRVLGVGACNWQIFWAESARARRAGGSAWCAGILRRVPWKGRHSATVPAAGTPPAGPSGAAQAH